MFRWWPGKSADFWCRATIWGRRVLHDSPLLLRRIYVICIEVNQRYCQPLTTTILSDFCLWKRNRIIWSLKNWSKIQLWFSIQIDFPMIGNWWKVRIGPTLNLNLHRVLLLFWIKPYYYLAIGSSIPIRRADVFSKAPLPPPLSYPLHFFSQFAKGYWVFSIVLEIQYPSEIERSRAALELLLCKTHRTHQIFSNRYILDKTMEKRKRIWLLPIGHFSAMLKIVL